ncbi:hypothetical protein GZL_08016 [Streptomyces sp. 769]|nr:hypothetical protein GZL_08016 [Streptomyces sp. 769]
MSRAENTAFRAPSGSLIRYFEVPQKNRKIKMPTFAAFDYSGVRLG